LQVRMKLYQKVDMNILKFAEEFPDETSCRTDFKSKREAKASFARSVAVRTIIGLKRSGNGNVRLYETIEETTLVFSDKSTSCVNISDYVEVHVQ